MLVLNAFLVLCFVFKCHRKQTCIYEGVGEMASVAARQSFLCMSGLHFQPSRSVIGTSLFFASTVRSPDCTEEVPMQVPNIMPVTSGYSSGQESLIGLWEAATWKQRGIIGRNVTLEMHVWYWCGRQERIEGRMQAKAMSFRGMGDEREGGPPRLQELSFWTSNKIHRTSSLLRSTPACLR